MAGMKLLRSLVLLSCLVPVACGSSGTSSDDDQPASGGGAPATSAAGTGGSTEAPVGAGPPQTTVEDEEGEVTSVSYDELPEAVREYLNRDEYERLVGLGLVVRGGDTPPDIAGSYEATGQRLIAFSQVPEDGAVVGSLQDERRYTFAPGTLDYQPEVIGAAGSPPADGTTTVIGTGQDFTAFMVLHFLPAEGGATRTTSVNVISGVLAENGIQSFQFGYLSAFGEVEHSMKLWEEDDRLATRVQ